MKALLVMDVQNFILGFGDFSATIEKIKSLISHYDALGNDVIFIQHVDDDPESPMYRENTDNVGLYINPEKHKVITKNMPDAFANEELGQYLKDKGITQISIAGFNAEICCKCTAIGGYYKGLSVEYIADACNTTNTPEMYEMPGLDIIRFVCYFLEDSGYAKVVQADDI